MDAVTLSELATRLGGEASEDAVITGACIDSRRVEPGDLFVALRGERSDGHDHVDAARAAGAAAALVARPVTAALPQWRVEDPAAALQALGSLARERTAAQVIGVTGSNGKTTVKRLLAGMLRRAGDTVATRGNYNNELGVPLTLCRLGGHQRYAVIEMGASSAGDIALLAGWARPAIGILTNASAAHLKGFGSELGVARAKGELFEALPADGTGIYPAGSAYQQVWAEQLAGRSTVEVGADASGGTITVAAVGPGRVRLTTGVGERVTDFALPGAHNRYNAAAAAAGAIAAGVGLDDVAAALAEAVPEPGRLVLRNTRQGAQLLDDSYNANPASLRAGLEVLAGYSGERLLVLGDMDELGDDTRRYHREAGQAARAAGVTRLFALGELAAIAAEAFGEGAAILGSHDALIAAVGASLHDDAAVLVKGSRRAALETVVAGLLTEPAQPITGGGS